VSGASRLRLGADLQRNAYTLRRRPDASNDFQDLVFVDVPDELVARLAADDVLTSGAYAELELDATERITLKPGVRADLHASAGSAELGLDARLIASFEASSTKRRASPFHSRGFNPRSTAACSAASRAAPAWNGFPPTSSAPR
jgi:hypothetical protein